MEIKLHESRTDCDKLQKEVSIYTMYFKKWATVDACRHAVLQNLQGTGE